MSEHGDINAAMDAAAQVGRDDGEINVNDRTRANLNVARHIFKAALVEDRAGELFEALSEGGGATVDAKTGKLVIITEAQLLGLAARDD